MSQRFLDYFDTPRSDEHYLDFVPKGRDEDHLDDPVSWVRFKDPY